MKTHLHNMISCMVTFFGIILVTAGAAGRDWTAGLDMSYREGGHTMKYRLYLPKDYNDSQEYPYLLFLHGLGERGTDNQRQVMYHIGGLIDRTYENYPAIFVAPQLASGWWGEADDLNAGLYDRLRHNYSIDENRIYLTGLSMGGYGTTSYAYAVPEMFAAIAPMSGAIDIPPSAGEPISKVPTWLFHGNQDTVVSVDTSRSYFRDTTGVSSIVFSEIAYGQPTAISGPIRYTEFVGYDHNIWSGIYGSSDTALYDWMFAQAIPEPSTFILCSLLAIATLTIAHCYMSQR